MIVYFADRYMTILGSASTELPSGPLIYDDLKTSEIEVGVSSLEFSISYDGETKEEIERWAEVGNYLIRQKDGDDNNEFYTIIDSEDDSKDASIMVYAEDAGLDLLNEIVEPYEADKAYPASYYINKFAYDSGFEVGLNEISDLSRKLKWEGESTATARILSVATQFDNAEISYSFDIKGLSIVKKKINIYKKRGTNTEIELRLDKDIDRIVTKKSVANLATAFRCTGGTPENSETPITLSGYKYDDGDYYVSGNILKCRSALAKWTRYLSETGNDEGHIVQAYSYDTLSQSELCNRAVSALKKVVDMEVNYEVDVAVLPRGVNIGDYVRIIDSRGRLYLSGRVLKLESSDSNNEHKATLGEYLIKSGGIAQSLKDLAAQFGELSKNRIRYTWTAYANDEEGADISLYPDGKVYMGTANNQLTYEPVLTDPSIYKWVKMVRYTWTAYANTSEGVGISLDPDGKAYLGTAANQLVEAADISDPSKYTWAKIKGADGKDGKTPYPHIAWADNADGTEGFSLTDSYKDYMGTYVDFVETASTDPAKYKWTKVKGDTGDKGDPGDDGKPGDKGDPGNDGKPAYIHIAYANNSTGTSGFSLTDSANKLFIGQYADFTEVHSTDPTKYKWTMIKGSDGADGQNGLVISATAPANPIVGQLWQAASGAVIKRWDGSTWAAYYFNIANLDVEFLSAIAANLGTVLAGVIKNLNYETEGGAYFDVTNGELYISDTYLNQVALLKGRVKTFFKDQNTNDFELSMGQNELIFSKPGSPSLGKVRLGFSLPTYEGAGPNDDTYGSKGILDMFLNNTPILQTLSVYRYAKTESPWAGSGSWEVVRQGSKVTMTITSTSTVISVNTDHRLGEYAIPLGFRPTRNIYAHHNCLVAGVIDGTGTYLFGANGSTRYMSNVAANRERHVTVTWYTADAFPDASLIVG